MPEESTPGRCRAPVHYAGNEYACSLRSGHPGPHRTWVQDADDEREGEQYGDRDEAAEMRERLGW